MSIPYKGVDGAFGFGGVCVSTVGGGGGDGGVVGCSGVEGVLAVGVVQADKRREIHRKAMTLYMRL